MRYAIPITALLLVACWESPPSTTLYAHPWPDERMRLPDGTLDLSGFPVGTGTPLRRQTLASLADARGFGVASGVFFPFDEPLDPASLPAAGTTTADASVFLVNVDTDSANFGARAPLDVRFLHDAGPFGGTHLLVLLPYPGLPLDPNTLYAAVVTTGVQALSGAPLLAEEAPFGGTEAHLRAADALSRLGVASETIAARAVYRTGDPSRGLREAVRQGLAEETLRIETPQLVETFDTFCVYSSSTYMPVYQAGEPPYERTGGGWVSDERGALVRQARMGARIWMTVPRDVRADPPTAVFVRAGGGGDRPLVDRGPRDVHGRSDPGTGIGRDLALAGYVGLSVDGPLGGARNLAGWDEQTALFNVVNPVALRDNVRQTALELVLFARAMDGLVIDTSACPGAAPEVRLDHRPVLIGHSTGATIAPLAAAVEERFSALVLSGAGASWIRQIVHKRSPVPLRPLADMLMGYWPHRALHEHDPMLSLMQWGGEPADPMVYGSALVGRDVLVFQGVLDTYIPPPISNPLTMSLQVDLGGLALDEGLGYRSAADDLSLSGGQARELPFEAGRGDFRVVTQHPPDGIEDGHEVLFQRPEARRQLRCFLETLEQGRPRLVTPRVPSGQGRPSCRGDQ